MPTGSAIQLVVKWILRSWGNLEDSWCVRVTRGDEGWEWRRVLGIEWASLCIGYLFEIERKVSVEHE
eukprot:1020901-Amorphochlora_amoeboformis.AAC.1